MNDYNAVNYAEVHSSNGDIIKYTILYVKPSEPSFSVPSLLKDQDLEKIKRLLRKNGIIEFTANMQVSLTQEQ